MEATSTYCNCPEILNEILARIKNNNNFIGTFVKPLYDYLSLIISVDDVVDSSLIAI